MDEQSGLSKGWWLVLGSLFIWWLILVAQKPILRWLLEVTEGWVQ